MNEPVFKSVFGADWGKLPPVMKKHYACRRGMDDTVTVTGEMDIYVSRLIKIIAPFLRFFGALVPFAGKDVPVTVHFRSQNNSDIFILDRRFNFPDKNHYRFCSSMQPIGGNEVIEFMRYGLGWKAAFSWTGDRVVLRHKGYVLKVYKFFIPLPLALLIGKGDAEEWPVTEDSFSMKMQISHPLWGKVYQYSGVFKVVS